MIICVKTHIMCVRTCNLDSRMRASGRFVTSVLLTISSTGRRGRLPGMSGHGVGGSPDATWWRPSVAFDCEIGRLP